MSGPATWAKSFGLTPNVSPEEQALFSSSGPSPFAVGNGTLAVRETSFDFSAHLDPKGGSGYAVIKDPTDGDAQGHVCPGIVIESPGTVQFWIEVEKGDGTLGLFPFIKITATDSGERPRTGAVPDSLVVQGASACTFPGTFGFGGPVDRGNIVVKP
jgi:hypothetical protein